MHVLKQFTQYVLSHLVDFKCKVVDMEHKVAEIV